MTLTTKLVVLATLFISPAEARRELRKGNGNGKSSSAADGYRDLLALVQSGACYANEAVSICYNEGDTSVSLYLRGGATFQDYCCPTDAIDFEGLAANTLCPVGTSRRRLVGEEEMEIDHQGNRRLAHLNCGGFGAINGIGVFNRETPGTYCCQEVLPPPVEEGKSSKGKGKSR